jgi:hypothetical protein
MTKMKHLSITIILLSVNCFLATNKCFSQLCFTAPDSFAIGSNPASIISADFNGDGKKDLATANWNANDVSIFLGTGAGSFGSATNFSVSANPQALIKEDFNGDGKADLAVVNQSSKNVSILLGNGSGGFSPSTDFGVDSLPCCITSADFNGDGVKDLAVGNYGSYNISVLFGTGTGSFGAANNVLAFSSSYKPVSITSADFNTDGKIDLVMTFYFVNNVYVSFGNGSGGFSAVTAVPVGSAPSVMSADFNADGKADLATANSGSNNVSVLLGTGTGSFSSTTNFSVGIHPEAVASKDFNQDGFLDLAVTNALSANVSILLGTGTGSFGTTINFAAGAKFNNHVISEDFNGDTFPDLALSGGNVFVLLNCTTVGITVPSNTQMISVYPNPSTNEITLGISDIPGYQNATITIQNILGQPIKKIVYKERIDIFNLTDGCYFLQLVLPGRDIYKTKFIKQ